MKLLLLLSLHLKGAVVSLLEETQKAVSKASHLEAQCALYISPYLEGSVQSYASAVTRT